MLYNLFENRDFVSVFAVALLAEGVDRNNNIRKILAMLDKSPSSRRAWIEIVPVTLTCGMVYVALLAEGVDRNTEREDKVAERNLSPSSRRAWIEIASTRPRLSA